MATTFASGRRASKRTQAALFAGSTSKKRRELTRRSQQVGEPLRTELVATNVLGEALDIDVFDPVLLCECVLAETLSLRRAYAESLAARPSTQAKPWHIVVAFDEYVPGDKRNPVNSRKSWC